MVKTDKQDIEMMQDKEMKYEFWLAGLHLSAGKKYLLRRHMNSAENVYYIEETDISGIQFLTEKEKNTIRQAQKGPDPEESYQKMEEKGIRFVPFFFRRVSFQTSGTAGFPLCPLRKGRAA